jgi:hypothetical protein
MQYPIYFYIPKSCWPETIPEDVDRHWDMFIVGPYNWTLQTYCRLKSYGFGCELVDRMPSKGIVFTHRDYLDDSFQPSSHLLLVCLQADRFPHPYAQIHIVQNPKQVVTRSNKFGSKYFLPHWPQPGLIPRDPNRGDRFENLGYFGVEKQLAPELLEPSYQEELNQLGLKNCTINTEHTNQQYRWNDYSQIDLFVAVRSFRKREEYLRKPATKLYGAWHAGVPAILGYESAYRAERQSELDYIEVASVKELLTAIERLRDDLPWRKAIIENGKQRAKETEPTHLTERWIEAIETVAIPMYEAWCSESESARQQFFKNNYLTLIQNKIERSAKEISSKAGNLIQRLKIS